MKTSPEHVLPPLYEVLDTDPVVSINLDVKKNLRPNEVFDVDYVNLRSTLEELGAPADSSDLSIEYTSTIDRSMSTYGQYSPDEQSILIKAVRKSSRMQTSLQHEIGHHVDILQNSLTNRDIRQNIAGKVGLITQQALLAPTAIAAATTAGSHLITHGITPLLETIQNVSEVANLSLSPLLLGATALSAFYYRHPREILARKAEKKSAPIVASIK